MRRSIALALVVFATAVPACEAAASTATVDEVTPTSIKYVGFKCNTTYRAVFRVVNANGTTSAGETINQTTKPCPTPVDTTPPTVSFTNPLASQTVRGTVNVIADASDAGGVWFTAFRVDSATADPTLDYSSPYGFALDTTKLADGPHTLYVRAEDNAQNVSPDSAVTFTVDNTTPPGTEPAPIAGQGYHEVFRDDFNTLDRSTWDSAIWYDCCPNPLWTNSYGGFQYADNGVLHLHTSRDFIGGGGEPYPMNTVTTQTSGKTWLHGYFEARMKWTGGQGAWPGFWLFSYHHATNDAYPAVNPYCAQNGEPVSHCYSGELDAFEGQGDQPTGFYGTVHRNSCSCYGVGDTQNDHNYDDTGRDLTADFHTYGMLWTSTTISWYLDGNLLYSAPAYDATEQPMYMLLQMWSGGWRGNPDATTPNDLDTQVDYVKVYQR